MRIIKLLFLSTLIIVMLGGAAFLVAREALLFVAVTQLKGNMDKVKLMGNNADVYAERCQKTPTSGALIEKVQSIELAFINERSYQIQLVCSQFQYEPVVISQETLPPFVVKQPGSGGVVWSEDTPTFVTITLWGRAKTLTLQGKKVIVSEGSSSISSALNPITSCEGVGYRCCLEASELGSGDQVTLVTDCPKSCFAQCEVRPVILSLNTQPFYDTTNRSVVVQSGQEIAVHYTVDTQGIPLKEVVLDLGNGQRLTSASASGNFSYVYRCTNPVCQYRLELSAKNIRDISNGSTTINHVYVNVIPDPY